MATHARLCRAGLWTGLALAGAVWLGGCSDEQPAPTGSSMAAAPGSAKATAAPRDDAAPRVTGVSLWPSRPQPGTRVEARANASDPDGDPVRLRYAWFANGTRIAGAVESAIVVPDLRKGTELSVSVVASDGRADSDPVSAEVQVGNRPPHITGIRFEPAENVRPGETVVAIVDGEDPDGDPIDYRYEWRSGEQVHPGSGARFDTKGLKRGDPLTVRVTASDGDDDSPVVEGPNLVMGNTAPSITSQPPAGMGPDGVYRYAVEVTDPDGDRNLHFKLSKAPQGMSIDPLLGEISWKPTFAQTGTHPIEVIVSDGKGGETSQRFEVSVREVGDGAPAPAKTPPAAPAD